jgi:glycine cleavage system H protein
MNIKEGLYYTKEHEWVKIEGKKAKTGISDYAQHKLGDITYVEPAAVGKTVKQFDVLTGVESVKAASDVFAALSGRVIAANPALEGSPELVNKEPYDGGWMAELEITDASETKNLMNAAAYTKYVESLEK